jgi:tetratricopeptide (TPR) repeat protein
MHDDLTELPEAIPLHRVSPAWRLLAILAVIIAMLALLGILAMSAQIAYLQSLQINRPIYSNPPVVTAPAPPPPPVVAVPVVNPPPDKPPIDPANLPYPIREDLRQSLSFATVPNEPEGTLRERFLRLGKEYWRCPSDWSISAVAVAPSGTDVAMFNGWKLLVGPYNNLREVDEPAKLGPNVAPPGTPPTARREAPASSRLVGYPAWSPTSRYVLYATAAGKMRRFDTLENRLETLPFRGQWPTAWWIDTNQVLFVRSQVAPKLDGVDGDHTELVVGDVTKKTVRVLVKASRAQWAYPAVLTDAKQIAVWSTLGREDGRYQLFLIDAATGAASPIQGIRTTRPGPIGWVPKESLLVYERGIEPPLPPDCLAMESHPVPNPDVGLFQYDLDTRTETRLSRGGGVGSPQIAGDGDLHYLGWKWQPERDRNALGLYRVPLATVRNFVGNVPPPSIRDLAGWTALIDQVSQEAKLPSAPAIPSADALSQMASTFAARYAERFGEKPPSSPVGFDRQLAELRDQPFPAEVRSRLLLILAAVQGEHLRKQHGAVWYIVDGAAGSGTAENAFGQAIGFFAFVERGLTDSTARSLNDVLRQAAGRTLILTNQPSAAVDKLAKLNDADMARGTALLEKGKSADAAKVFDGMLQREANRRNQFLALQVARLLYDSKRLADVEAIMERIADEPPADPQVFNLLGLALLDRDPRSAINAFKKALRCDLQFGPAYFNLATAHLRAGDTPSAAACLKRYLELLPKGPLANDAARRLADLGEDPTK